MALDTALLALRSFDRSHRRAGSRRIDTLESDVLDRLRAEFRNPQVITAYVKEYHAERARLSGTKEAKRATLTRRLAQNERETKRTVDAIVAGADTATMAARTRELAAERTALQDELAAIAETTRVVALHPAVLKRFKQQCVKLQATLGTTIAHGDQDAVAAIRDLVETVTVRRAPDRPHGFAIAIKGRLESLCEIPATGRPVGGTLVAGEGLEPPTYGL